MQLGNEEYGDKIQRGWDHHQWCRLPFGGREAAGVHRRNDLRAKGLVMVKVDGDFYDPLHFLPGE